MIKVLVLYPNTPDGRFDLEYYQTRHVPMVIDRCAGAIVRGEIERGVSGFEPGSPAQFCIGAHLIFESAESMQQSFGRHLPEFIADLPNFTNIQPTVQISEVLV
jgi:uncharacterized protein (TIGR02118 family)